MGRAGKTYIVTGGASGLGLATVKRLHSEGANVAIIDKDKKGEEIATELGKTAVFCETDMTNEDSVKGAVEKAVATFGGLHGIVNCAGMGMAMTTIGKDLAPHKSGVFDFIMKLNTYGTFWGSAYAASAMAKCPAAEDGSRGVIVNVASVAGIEGQKGQLVYSASKGAVIGMTLPMARDLARYGRRRPVAQGALPRLAAAWQFPPAELHPRME